MSDKPDSRFRPLIIFAIAALVLFVFLFGLWMSNQPQVLATPSSTSAQVVSTTILVGKTFDPQRTPPTEEPGAIETRMVLVITPPSQPILPSPTISPLGAPKNTFRLDLWLSVFVILTGLLTIVGLELRKRSRKR